MSRLRRRRLFVAKQKEADDELGTLLKRYNEDVLKALKAKPQDAVANAQFQFCAELTAVLFSEEEADLPRRARRSIGGSLVSLLGARIVDGRLRCRGAGFGGSLVSSSGTPALLWAASAGCRLIKFRDNFA